MDELTREEQEIIRQCLRAAADGPFFPDWGFRLLFGAERNELRELADDRRFVDADPSAERAINNTLINLLHYPHYKWQCWGEWIAASPPDVRKLLLKWRNLELEAPSQYVHAVA